MVLKHYHSEAATVSNSIISWTIKYILGTLAGAVTAWSATLATPSWGPLAGIVTA